MGLPPCVPAGSGRHAVLAALRRGWHPAGCGRAGIRGTCCRFGEPNDMVATSGCMTADSGTTVLRRKRDRGHMAGDRASARPRQRPCLTPRSRAFDAPSSATVLPIRPEARGNDSCVPVQPAFALTDMASVPSFPSPRRPGRPRKRVRRTGTSHGSRWLPMHASARHHLILQGALSQMDTALIRAASPEGAARLNACRLPEPIGPSRLPDRKSAVLHTCHRGGRGPASTADILSPDPFGDAKPRSLVVTPVRTG